VIDAPAHEGLVPEPLAWGEAAGEWAGRIAAAADAARVERALRPKPEPRGYYRLTARANGARYFGKVVAAADAPRQWAAQQLSDRAAAAGIPAQRSVAAPRDLGDGFALLLCEWVDGRFATPSEAELAALGGVVASLHGFLRGEARDGRGPDPWDRLERLASSTRPSPQASAVLADLLRRRGEVEAQLAVASQPIHNDLHAGNVFFGAGAAVAAVLDWEEALHSAGCPLVDLGWVVERLCFVRLGIAEAERVAAAFLEAYANEAPRFPVRRGALLDAIRWRSLYALGVIDGDEGADAPALRGEWAKFESIVAASEGWRPALERLEAIVTP
jgi:Ser/Thr protein kinase RdoA (MazF antagonist)